MAYQRPENRSGLECPNNCLSNAGKTIYVVGYGEVLTDFQMPVGKSGVIWTITKK